MQQALIDDQSRSWRCSQMARLPHLQPVVHLARIVWFVMPKAMTNWMPTTVRFHVRYRQSSLSLGIEPGYAERASLIPALSHVSNRTCALKAGQYNFRGYIAISRVPTIAASSLLVHKAQRFSRGTHVHAQEFCIEYQYMSVQV